MVLYCMIPPTWIIAVQHLALSIILKQSNSLYITNKMAFIPHIDTLPWPFHSGFLHYFQTISYLLACFCSVWPFSVLYTS